MKTLYIILCLNFLLLFSCEELVETDYPTNQIGTAQVFEDNQTAYAALSGLYASLRDQSILSGNSYGTGALLGSYVDDMDCYYMDENGYMDIYRNQQQETNSTIERLWDFSFQYIYKANSIIYGVENSTSLPESDSNQIKGEAIVIRSLIYFYMERIFGAIPYTSSIDYEYNRTLKRLESTEIFQRIENDLLEAIDLLNDNYRDHERIYVNAKVAELLLAKIYLLEQNYDQAIEVTERILNSPLYQFQTDIHEVFHKSGTHILWQLIPENSGDSTKEATFFYFSGSAPNAYALTTDLVGIFSDNDMRKINWISEESVDENTWYRPIKYKNLSGNNSNEYSVIFRLAEAYFIMAESLLKQGRSLEALPYLNAIRERAGLEPLNELSGDEFIDALLIEKRKEFFAEFGHRFLDLKRLGRLEALNDLKSNWSDFHKIWPLPQKELLLNSNLTPQNNGY